MISRIQTDRLRRAGLFHYLRQGIIPTASMLDQYVLSRVPRGLNQSTVSIQQAVPYSERDIVAVRQAYRALLDDSETISEALLVLRDKYNNELLPALQAVDSLAQNVNALLDLLQTMSESTSRSVWEYTDNLQDLERIDTTLTDAIVLPERGVAYGRGLERAAWYEDIADVKATTNGYAIGNPEWAIARDEDSAWITFGSESVVTELDIRLPDKLPVSIVDVVPIGQFELKISVSEDGLAFVDVAGSFITGSRIFLFDERKASVIRLTMNGMQCGIKRVRVGVASIPGEGSVVTKEFVLPKGISSISVERFGDSGNTYYSLNGSQWIPYKEPIPVGIGVRELSLRPSIDEKTGLNIYTLPDRLNELVNSLYLLRGYDQWKVTAYPVSDPSAFPSAMPSDYGEGLVYNSAMVYSGLNDLPTSFPYPLVQVVNNDGNRWLAFPVNLRSSVEDSNPRHLQANTYYSFETYVYISNSTTWTVQAQSLVSGSIACLFSVEVNDNQVLRERTLSENYDYSVQVTLNSGWNRIRVRILPAPSTTSGVLLLRLPATDHPVSVWQDRLQFTPIDVLMYGNRKDMSYFYSVEDYTIYLRPVYKEGSYIDGIFVGAPELIYARYALNSDTSRIRFRFDIPPNSSFRGYRMQAR